MFVAYRVVYLEWLADYVNLSNSVAMLKHKVKKSFLTLLREAGQESMYTMGKLPPSSLHFNHGTIIQTGI